jgi:hypothetical protein
VGLLPSTISDLHHGRHCTACFAVLKQFTAVKYVRNFLREFCTVSTVFKFFRVMQPVYIESLV